MSAWPTRLRLCQCPISDVPGSSSTHREIINGEIHENAIVQAANVALENMGKTLTWMLTPRLLKPLVWSLVEKLPPQQIRALNVARMQLYTAALTLARNAMGRLGTAWTDELNMSAAFGKSKSYANFSAAVSHAPSAHVNARSTQQRTRLRSFTLPDSIRTCLLKPCRHLRSPQC